MGLPLAVLQWPPWSLALLVALLWSLPAFSQKLLLQRFPLHMVMTFSALFYLVFTALLLLHHWSPGAQKELGLLRRYSPWVLLSAAAALFSGFVPNYLFTHLIEQRHPAYWVTAITFSSPVFTTLLAILFLDERPTLQHLGGIAFVVTGIFLLTQPQANAVAAAPAPVPEKRTVAHVPVVLRTSM